MPRHALPPRSRWIPALALLGTLALPASAHAGFELTYLFTDSEGQPLSNARLTSNDMLNYVNQGTCQCGQTLAARIFLNNTVEPTYNANDRVFVYVGTSCSDAQNVNSNFPPCVQLNVGPANEFDDQGKFLAFDTVWLVSSPGMINQDISASTPQSPCQDGVTGTGKIWICVDSDGNSQCLSDEFVSPTLLNTTDTGSGGTPAADDMDGGQPMAGDGINYDYLAPQNAVSGFSSSAGDGKVVISWDRAEVNDISGFRVLCADAAGNPAKTGITSAPTGQARTNGTLYYTADNLCDMPLYQPAEAEPEPEPSDESGTDGGTGTTGRSELEEDWQGDGWSRDSHTGSSGTAGTGGTGTTGGSGTTGGTGTPGGSGTTGSSGGTEGSGTAGTGDDNAGVECTESGSPLCDLDWSYVCSDHIQSTGVSATVQGLRNGEPYQFLVVAYDSSGNPSIISPVFTETPIETTDFWEQCEMQGDLCGSGGFCHCRSGATSGAAWLGTGLLLLLFARRRRAR